MRTALRLTAACLALALAPAARAELKIGYVAFQRALGEVGEGKAILAVLKKDAEEKQKQLDVRSAEVDRLGEELQKQAQILTPEARAAKGAEFQRKLAETREMYVRLDRELAQKDREARRPLEEKLTAVAREIAETEGFAYLLDSDTTHLVFAQASLDLTAQVIRRYDAKFPPGAKKAEPAPAKKADAPAPAPAPKVDAPVKK
jgi:outer membrane protein